jgi:hypothetical protein
MVLEKLPGVFIRFDQFFPLDRVSVYEINQKNGQERRDINMGTFTLLVKFFSLLFMVQKLLFGWDILLMELETFTKIIIATSSPLSTINLEGII